MTSMHAAFAFSVKICFRDPLHICSADYIHFHTAVEKTLGHWMFRASLCHLVIDEPRMPGV